MFAFIDIIRTFVVEFIKPSFNAINNDMLGNVSKCKYIVQNKKTLIIVWTIMTIVCCALKLLRPEGQRLITNFIIYRNSFWHAIDGLSLYALYSEQQIDIFLYGVSFTSLIAPFAIMPVFHGMLLWCVTSTLLLYIAIRKLHLSDWKFAFIIWLCANELFTSLLLQQYNVAIAAMVILAYAFTEKKQEFWAALMIVLATITKIYGIVGIIFILFSQRKRAYALSILFWAAVLFVLPMLYTSPDYVIHQYGEWIDTIFAKNCMNIDKAYTNISLLGMAHRISGDFYFSDLWILIPGAILFVIPYFRRDQYYNRGFQLATLSSALMVYVIFSTGTENSGYISAMIAVCLWYISTPTYNRDKVLNTSLFIFCFILTSLSPTDVFPAFLREEYVRPYSLKALPCALIWLKIIFEQISIDYSISIIPNSARYKSYESYFIKYRL